MLVVVACLGTGCTSDDDVTPGVSQSQASDPDGSVVEAPDSSAFELKVKVSNTGAPCSLLARDCVGSAPQCLEISLSGAFYSGGYCTADCQRSAECGPNAECPVGEAIQVAPGYEFRSTWARKCFKSCTPGNVGECRSGYQCTSLAAAYGAPDAPAPMHRTTCLPSSTELVSPDSGVAVVHNIDAGR